MMLPLTLLLLQASVSGTVTDSVSGAPIRKAKVILSNSFETVITDASGTFRFDQVPPGFKVLDAHHPDYAASRATSFGRANFTLAPNEQLRGLDLKLTPAASVSGQITDEDSDPLQNCTVTLFSTGPSPLTAVTDATGTYAFQAIASGHYRLMSRCPAPPLQPRPYGPPGASTSRHQLGYPFQTYPGTLDLHAGQSLSGIGIRMVPQPVSTIAVHVTNPQAVSPIRMMASLIPEGDGPQRQEEARVGFVLPRNGEARIDGVPNGQYTLRVVSVGVGLLLFAKQSVQIEDGTTDLSVTISPPVALAGVITAQGLDQQPNQLWLNEVTEPGISFHTAVKPDGTFSFLAVSPGRYRVSTNVGPWIQSMSLGGEYFESNELTLKPGATGRLEIAMSNARGSVSGDVDTGSKRSAPITIIAIMASMGTGTVQLELSNATGTPPHFSAKLAPGRYRIYAVESKTGLMLENNDTLAALGEAIEIRTGNETVKNLKLITTEMIEEADR